MALSSPPTPPFPNAISVSDMALFSTKQTIRFSDCDPAGIVYYPNYFNMAQALVEDWFGQSLGMPYAELLNVRKIALPTVHLTVDFNRPSRLGEVLTWSLKVEGLGRSSIRLKLIASADNVERLSIQQVIVTIDPTGKSVTIPPELRVKVANYQSATAAKKA
ncbi:MAG: acyl-CoA thioesterase [Alphaproteobacteria bacterium]|nr:acyl-CoA thioesterase [Alphaproteobacteria bacterium]